MPRGSSRGTPRLCHARTAVEPAGASSKATGLDGPIAAVPHPPLPAGKRLRLVRSHWSFLVPLTVRELYALWLARRRYRLNLEQIEEDELDEVATTAMHDDSSETIQAIYDKDGTRRVIARFHVAAAERPKIGSASCRERVRR